MHQLVIVKDPSLETLLYEVAEFMISIGADPHIKDKLGDTPISKAIGMKRTELVRILQDQDESGVSTPSTAFSSNI